MRIDVSQGRFGDRLFDQQLRPRVLVMLGVLAFNLTWAIAAVVAAAIDHTLRLPSPGRGLLDHYGFQACLVSASLVLMTVYYAISFFLRTLHGLDDLVKPGVEAAVIYDIIKPHIRSLFLRGRWRNMLWLFMFTGAAISIAVFRELHDPARFWGNDVFNATSYKYGFIIANIFLFILWSAIYPLALFYALHLTVSTEMIISQMSRKNLLKLNFLHIDKCGGMSRFGTMNFIIMLVYLWLFGVAYALHITHKSNYISLILGGLAVSAAFILQSIYGLYWISRSIKSEREKTVSTLNDRITATMYGGRKNFSAALATMEYRDKVLSISAFPYSGLVNAAVNTLRIAPAIFSFAHVLFKP